MPYSGFEHDSRLYAAQVSERIAPGSFDRDLYLLYGSQDRYTLFSLLIHPLVQLLGLRIAFLVVYLVSKALLYWGAMQLIQVVVKDRLVTLVSLLFIALCRVPIGGNSIFHLNEAFLTRIRAVGLVLLALERMVSGRLLQASALLVGSFLLIP